MAIFSVRNVQIAGVSACVPKNKVSNLDYDWITLKERKLLIKTTGIAHRRIVPKGVCTSDLCLLAAGKLLQELHWQPQDIDLIIFVSQTPDYILPATAIILQNRLGLSKNTLAFDINLGCSGYVYGLSVVANLLQGGQMKKALLLVGDTSSVGTSPRDKSTTPLFGDAGSCTALEYCDLPNTTTFYNLQSDGTGQNAIIIEDGAYRNPIDEHYTFAYQEHQPGIIRNGQNLALEGMDIFNFTLREVAPNIRQLLAHFQKNLSTIDYFLFHQANLLMNESVRKKLKIPKEKVPYSLKDFGNTSSASIPLTMVTQLQTQLTQQKLSLLLTGFGVGLSWGSCLLQTDQIACPDLVEV